MTELNVSTSTAVSENQEQLQSVHYQASPLSNAHELNNGFVVSSDVCSDSAPSVSTSCCVTETQATMEPDILRQNCADEAEMELEATKEFDRGRRKRSRDMGDPDLEIMDHSGLQQGTKRVKTQYKDRVMLCSPLSYDSIKDEPPDKVTRELARCLHEPKLVLISEVLRVLGVERTLEVFQQTAVVQETGGTLTADGTKKKSPGGVFLTLVKQTASEEEKTEIFQKDKQIASERKRRAKMKKRLDKERVKEREQRRNAQRQLQVFRSQLCESGLPSGGDISEWDCSLCALPQANRNIHKRLGKRVQQDGGDGTEPTGQLVENNSKQEIDSGQMQEVKEAAEEFEQMNEYQLDFGID